jgi:hypothetical protein
MNEKSMKRLLTILLTGERWVNGVRHSGFSHAHVEGEDRSRYYTESHSLLDIIADLKEEGIDTAAYERGLVNWVATGQPFDVLTGHNCVRKV